MKPAAAAGTIRPRLSFYGRRGACYNGGFRHGGEERQAGVTIGFVGAGQMAKALGKGFVDAGLCAPADVVACARRPASAEDWARHTGGQALPDAAAVAAAADVLVLAMKPPQAPAVMATLQPLLQPRHVVVSVAAGVRLTTLAAGLGPGVRLLRAMPNTPCLVGAGATGVAAGPQATAEDRALALRLFGAVGVAEEVPEALLDAVTGVSGSGPAYFFLAIEGLADGGVRAGLPRATALRLAAQAALGAARLVLETGQHPGALKDQVASPGGTTIAALASLERAAVRSAFLEAAVAAADRAREMGTS